MPAEQNNDIEHADNRKIREQILLRDIGYLRKRHNAIHIGMQTNGDSYRLSTFNEEPHDKAKN